MSETCKRCEENQMPGPEMFKWGWGQVWYDVDKGYRIAAEEKVELETVPVSILQNIVQYPKRSDGKFDLFLVQIDEEHLDHVDPDKPLLFAREPPPEDGRIRRSMLIDGHHRLARAIRDGKETISGYSLSDAQTNRIMRDNRRDATKRKARRNAKKRREMAEV
jgi:hypothetical protein